MRRVLTPVPIAVLCVVLALVALLAYGLAQNEPDRSVEDALARGEREEAPAFELPQLSGDGQGALADYRGEVVVLNFWASWCEPVPRGVAAARALARADREDDAARCSASTSTT